MIRVSVSWAFGTSQLIHGSIVHLSVVSYGTRGQTLLSGVVAYGHIVGSPACGACARACGAVHARWLYLAIGVWCAQRTIVAFTTVAICSGLRTCIGDTFVWTGNGYAFLTVKVCWTCCKCSIVPLSFTHMLSSTALALVKFALALVKFALALVKALVKFALALVKALVNFCLLWLCTKWRERERERKREKEIPDSRHDLQ